MSNDTKKMIWSEAATGISSLAMKDIESNVSSDRGCDPLGDGKFKMWPSGDIVDAKEKEKRLAHVRQPAPQNDCMGRSWDEIEAMQGGRLKRDA